MKSFGDTERERERDHDGVIYRAYFIVFLFSKHLDIMLPDLVSIDFLRLLRLHNNNSKTIFIRLLTAHSSRSSYLRSQEIISGEKECEAIFFFFVSSVSFPVFL